MGTSDLAGRRTWDDRLGAGESHPTHAPSERGPFAPKAHHTHKWCTFIAVGSQRRNGSSMSQPTVPRPSSPPAGGGAGEALAVCTSGNADRGTPQSLKAPSCHGTAGGSALSSVWHVVASHACGPYGIAELSCADTRAARRALKGLRDAVDAATDVIHVRRVGSGMLQGTRISTWGGPWGGAAILVKGLSGAGADCSGPRRDTLAA